MRITPTRWGKAAQVLTAAGVSALLYAAFGSLQAMLIVGDGLLEVAAWLFGP
jgi:hypothetical protein